MSASGGTPTNPMPPFIGSFISVNGRPLVDHIRMISEIPSKIEALTDQDLETEIEDAKQFAQTIVPVDTGYLRSTIDWERLSRYIYRFFASAAYANFVEEGTHRQRAQPYMAPAIARLKEKMPQVIITRVRGFFV